MQYCITEFQFKTNTNYCIVFFCSLPKGLFWGIIMLNKVLFNKIKWFKYRQLSNIILDTEWSDKYIGYTTMSVLFYPTSSY